MSQARLSKRPALGAQGGKPLPVLWYDVHQFFKLVFYVNT
jgi:hypothetical protein